MAKKTYMVAAQLTIHPVVYIEVIAESEAEAVAQVKEDKSKLAKLHKKAFEAEAKLEIDEASAEQMKIFGVGRAKQYHSSSECKLCSKVDKENSNDD